MKPNHSISFLCLCPIVKIQRSAPHTCQPSIYSVLLLQDRRHASPADSSTKIPPHLIIFLTSKSRKGVYDGHLGLPVRYRAMKLLSLPLGPKPCPTLTRSHWRPQGRYGKQHGKQTPTNFNTTSQPRFARVESVSVAPGPPARYRPYSPRKNTLVTENTIKIDLLSSQGWVSAQRRRAVEVFSCHRQARLWHYRRPPRPRAKTTAAAVTAAAATVKAEAAVTMVHLSTSTLTFSCRRVGYEG